jgi:predicted nucleic acid-binding protein
MINVGASIAVKWFKPGERFEAEALDLLTRIGVGAIAASACEILSLEVVRALQNAQVRQPALGITDSRITQAYERLEGMFTSSAMLECAVSNVKSQAKEIQMTLGLFMADALHLATAVYLTSSYFVVDDRHFLAPDVINYAAGFGVQVVTLPGLIAALGAAAGGASPPTP